MGLAATGILYLLIGGAVATASALRESSRGTLQTAGSIILTTLFWPLYIPGLLSGTDAPDVAVQHGREGIEPRDDLAEMVGRVESELDRAVRSLDGWAESALSSQQTRLEELKQIWRIQAQRIRELDELLVDPSLDEELTSADQSNVARTEQGRRDNLAQLLAIRNRLHDDLLASLAAVRELATMIHLARYTGAPAAKAEQLVAEIAAAVEGLSAVSAWDAAPGAVA